MMESQIKLKGLIVSQYGSVSAYADFYNKNVEKLSYTSILHQLNNPDSLTIRQAKKLLSIVNLSGLQDPYSILFGL